MSNELRDNKKMVIQEAQEEYDSLVVKLRDYEQTKVRMSQLEAFINTGKALWGIDVKPASETKTPAPVVLPSSDNIQPITHLQSIIKIISDAGHILSLSEMDQEYRKRNWKLSEANGREVLRGILIRHSENFTKTLKGNVGYYGLAT